MVGSLSIENVGYHRGVDGNIYFSANLLLNGKQVAFYNSEFIDLIFNDEIEGKLNMALVKGFEKHNVSGKSIEEKTSILMEKLKKLSR